MNNSRISVSEKDGSTSIIILSQKDKKKQGILLSWIILWSLGGLIVISQLFTNIKPEEKLFMGVWLAFWVYFELITWHAYLWRKNGFERLLVKAGKLYYRREIKDKGKTFTYESDYIKSLGLIDASGENSFLKSLRQSYWVIGGESISFYYEGKLVKLGLQLEKEDSQKVLRLLEKKLKLN